MIVITTPTGQIGSQLLDILLTDTPRHEKLRVILRDPGKLPDAVRARVDVVTGSHGDPEVVDRAFAGANAVFWLVPSNGPQSSLDAMYTGFTRPAAEAFRVHRVQRVVGVSALGRGTPLASHAGQVTASLAMDDLRASTGVAYRALANPTFMDNLLRQVDSIRDDGVFTDIVTPDHKAPIAATHDIAKTAATLLLDTSWTGTSDVPVLGPEDLSANDMAHIMTDVLDRPIHYHQQSLEEYRSTLTTHGLGNALIQGYIDMMHAKNNGLDNTIPRTPHTTTPTTFHKWCQQTLKPTIEA